MDQANAKWTPAQAAALEFAWGEYRVWSATSRQKKAEIFSWKYWVLVLTVAGAILATVSKELATVWSSAAWAIGIIGGISIALATILAAKFSAPIKNASG